jgi:hypothetical protein
LPPATIGLANNSAPPPVILDSHTTVGPFVGHVSANPLAGDVLSWFGPVKQGQSWLCAKPLVSASTTNTTTRRTVSSLHRIFIALPPVV